MAQWGVLVIFLFGLVCTESFGALKLKPLIKGLSKPVAVEVPPGVTDKLYVVEQAGKILIWHKGKVQPKPLLDISGKVEDGGERGLLGLAFHPKYKENGRYFVNYTTRRSGKSITVISEFGSGRPGEREILNLVQPYANHNGGQIAFGPNGMLFIGTGDGGAAGDPKRSGQNKKALLGKILRINVDGKKPYGIPSDNPFIAGGGAPEVYAFGLRNPWRFSFDSKTKVLIAADVGQNAWEEIDRIDKGGNYGWNVMEGNHCYPASRVCIKKGLVPPLWEYPRSEGISVTGGYVYRGAQISELQGVYVYGDYGSGRIWGLKLDESQRRAVDNSLLVRSREPVSSFGLDAKGEILVVSHYGTIFQIVGAK